MTTMDFARLDGALVTNQDEEDGQCDHQERGLELIHTPKCSTRP